MIEEKIREDLKKAQKAKIALEVSTLRLLLAALLNRRIERQAELSDEDEIQVIQTQIKQRKESVEAFRTGGREELAKKEEEEIKVLSRFLPPSLSWEELEKLVDEAIAKTQASGQDFGKVMSAVMPQIKGRAEGQKVAEVVRERLGR